jgi:hypothetical protein
VPGKAVGCTVSNEEFSWLSGPGDMTAFKTVETYQDQYDFLTKHHAGKVFEYQDQYDFLRSIMFRKKVVLVFRNSASWE